MGVCTALVSNATKSWFDLGKVFLDAPVLDRMRRAGAEDGALEREILAALQDADFNIPSRHDDAARDAATVAAWVRAHPDWRFLTEADDEDVYLAVDDDDAREYVDEFGEEENTEFGQQIYKKDGSI